MVRIDMKKEKSIKLNFIYNFILTFVNMLFPLITAPYLSNVLGAQAIGTVNYATSIINWFIIFATFGIPRYAVREIAKHREDKEKISMIFWNIISVQTILTLICSAIYITMIFAINMFHDDLWLYLLMLLMLILNIFSIDWFYQGIEEYGYITSRNILIKVISIVLIFLMIRDKEDYIFYAGINIFGLCFNNILNYLHSQKFVYKKIYQFKPFYYLKELKIFFLIALVVALYTQLDQVFLGTIDKVELAYFVRSKSIYGIGSAICASLITVISPRAAYLAHNNFSEYRKTIQVAINYIYVLSFPISIGLFILADEAMYVLGGREFQGASICLKIMAPIITVSTLGSWVSGQILIPNKLEEKSFRIQCISVVISVISNVILIPKFSYIGAALTWLIVETFLFITKSIYAKKKCKNLNINFITGSGIKYLISALLMGIVIVVIKPLIENPLLYIIISMSTGVIVYAFLLFCLKEEIFISNIKIVFSKLGLLRLKRRLN